MKKKAKVINDLNLNKTATFTGILFLTAMVASLVGGGLLETAQKQSGQMILTAGVTLEIVNALSVLGIGIFLFPVLKAFHKRGANAYLTFRILESLACFAAPLVLVLATGNNNLRAFFTGTLIPLFFCAGALVFYTILYMYRLLPRFISVWGFIGVVSIIALNIVTVKTNAAIILALPIILNEIFLGIWLIVKGLQVPGTIKKIKIHKNEVKKNA